jgi:predicted acyl esterase
MIDTWMTHFKHIGTTVDWVTDPANAYYNDFYKVKSAQLYWPVKPATGWWYDKNEKGEILEIKEGRRSIPPKLAIFITDGWYNIFTMSALDTYQYGLFKHEPGNKALVMGPWYHLSGAAGLGVDGFLPTTADIAARWFDWKIKGEKDSFMTQYPVLLYVMGVDRWRAEKDWPINDERAVSSSLFLSRQKPSVISGDKFSTKNAGNNFSLKESASAWDYKGESPVMVHNPLDLKGVKSRSFNRWIAGIFSVMAEMDKAKSGKDDSGKWWEDERDDEQGMLTFTTEPLDRDIEITGGLSLEFWAKSKFPENLTQQAVVKITDKIREIYDIKNGNLILDNMNKKDVQWVVEINDVFEDGRAKNITSGWLSAWRRPFDPENVQNADPAYVPLDPFYIVNRTNLGLPQEDKIVEDKLYCYVVEIWPTCNVFKKGHRIRLSISGSDFPHMLPVMIPSESTIVIDNDHQARLDFTTIVNSDKSPEGGNWKWLRYRNSAKFNKYLAAVSNEFDAANSYLLGLGEDEQKLEPGPGPGPQPVPDPNPEPVTPEDSADSDSDSSFCFVRMAKL